MKYVIGVLLGLAWGGLAAVVNMRISRGAIRKNSTGIILGASAARMLVDLVTLGVIFLLRDVLPFRFEWMMVAAALAMSLCTVVFAYRFTRPDKTGGKQSETEKKEENGK